MGNNQSSAQNTECSSFCKALCFGSPQNSADGDEWFGDLPRDKNKKRRKSRTSRRTSRLASVPEEGTTCSDTTEAEESTASSLPRTKTKSLDEGDGEGAVSRPNLHRGAVSEPQIRMKPASKEVKLPKTKLTFVMDSLLIYQQRRGEKL